MADYDPHPLKRVDFCLSDRDMLRDTSRDVKELLSQMAAHHKEDDERFRSQGIRIGKVEKYQTKIAAVIGFVGIVGGMLVPEAVRTFFLGHR